jgi:hypothetical protein
MMSVNPVSYIARSPRLLAQLREVLLNKHYSLRTEEAYVYRVKFLRCGSVVTAGHRGIFRVFLASSRHIVCAERYRIQSK